MVCGFTAGKSKLSTEYNTSSAISVLFHIRFKIVFNIKSAVCSTLEIETAHLLNSSRFPFIIRINDFCGNAEGLWNWFDVVCQIEVDLGGVSVIYWWNRWNWEVKKVFKMSLVWVTKHPLLPNDEIHSHFHLFLLNLYIIFSYNEDRSAVIWLIV